MALRTARPSYRLDKTDGTWVVTALPVVNRVQIIGEQVKVDAGDVVALDQSVTELIAKTRERYGSVGK